MPRARGWIALPCLALPVIAGCASPEVEARNFLALRFPPGSDAGELRAALERRGYWRIDTDCTDAVPSATIASCPAGATAQRLAAGATCMVRERQFFLASGNYVCWTEENGRIIATRADWLGGALPPPVTQP